ncbi:MAG: ATP-dependent zinc metalloprotease FtsH [Lachnospiraceae bacterium]|nr:ATP-dependent zinc metalloprotease FtsH [Lachnospiraceae bacterium]
MENKGNNNNNGGNNNGGNNKNGMTIMIFILAALLVLFLTSLLNSCAKDATNKEITYSEFIDMVEKDKVESVTFTSSRINITPKGENKLYRINYYTAELNDESLLPLLKEHNVKFGGTVEDVSTMIMWNMLSYILPLVLVWVLLYFLIFRKMGSGGMMGVGKTTAKVYVEKSTGVTFEDVAGQDEAKESLQEVVDFLHNPRKYTDIGAKLPKGALLVGPPGTGKTLLAKAVAGEAKVPFFSLAGSDFVEMFVGVGASRVRDLFKEAQKQAPCIIFIDEIDAIGKSRDTRYGGNDEREQTLNQLLAEMDGFDTSKGLLILAATNRPEVLDKALLRPGRFDRRIIVDKPDLKGRVETLKVHAKNVLLDDSVDLDAIALATSGAVGSDLANMINEAAINAVKQGRKYVNQSDLFESVEVVIAGKEKKDRIMGPKEKKMVAYHEVGHALVTALQKDAEPVQKITIVPRTMGALGYTMQVPEEEKFLMTKNELVAHLVTYMGGRAAEEIVFDSVTTGASNDIEQATKIARAMVTQYGMSEKFGLMGLVTIESQYLDGRASLNCGEETAAQIDQEVMRILKESYDEATRLLLENRDILDKISQHLYEHETITGKEFMKIFRELKGIPEPEEKTEAEKAAEGFQAEAHAEPSAPAVEIQEEEILVNTLREEDLPLETAWAEDTDMPLEAARTEEPDMPPETARAEAADLPKEQELEVNTLEGEELPGELTAMQREESAQQPSEEIHKEPEHKVELIPVEIHMPRVQNSVPPEETREPEPSVSPEETRKPEPSVSPEETRKSEPSVSPEETIEPESAVLEKEEEPEPAVLEQPKEREHAVLEKKEEPVLAEISTPEELGFFPAKKGSGKKAKSVSVKAEESPQGQQPAAQGEPAQEQQPAAHGESAQRQQPAAHGESAQRQQPEAEKTEQEAEEDYLDQLLKELK